MDACPVDVKRHVLENVLLCGGGAEIRGLLHRITFELRYCTAPCPSFVMPFCFREALQKHPTMFPLADKLTIGRPDYPPVLLQWIGAAAASAAIEAVEVRKLLEFASSFYPCSMLIDISSL